MIRTAVPLVVCLMWVCGGAAAAGDPNAGRGKTATCVACHGPDGNSTNPEWPSLAGQNAKYLADQIRAFQTGGTRSNVLMAPMIANLSDEDIEDIAAYYASLRRKPAFADESKAGMIEDGERLYRGGDHDKGIAACMGCHGPDGTGNALAGFPSLASQHAVYTAKQLEAFRSGERKSDLNAMMRDVSSRLSDYQIEALSAYLRGLN